MNKDTVIRVGGDDTIPALTPEQFVDGLNQLTGQNYKYEGFEEFIPEPDSVIGPAQKAADDMKDRLDKEYDKVSEEIKDVIGKMKDVPKLQKQGLENEIKNVSRINHQAVKEMEKAPLLQTAGTLKPLPKEKVPRRDVERLYEGAGHTVVCADDDTVWILIKDNWVQMNEPKKLPFLPQPNPLKDRIVHNGVVLNMGAQK